MGRLVLVAMVSFSIIWGAAKPVFAECLTSMLNPIDDIDWEAVFPLKIGGVTITGSDIPDAPDAASALVCACPIPVPPFIRPGTPVAFWEPVRMVETVQDPWCFPTIGVTLPNPWPGTLHGSASQNVQSDTGEMAAYQSHYFVYPVWMAMGLLTDSLCVEPGGFDVAYMTEVDALWQSDLLAFFLNPEALLFANPVASMACIADSVGANLGYPIPFLFWCMGSWGNAYPLSGSTSGLDEQTASAAIAGRMVYKMGRMGMAYDTATNLCVPYPAVIWNKSNYRFGLSKPVKSSVTQIGKSGFIWGAGKGGSGNRVWTLWRKRACCAG